jgi:hypothetical protein
MKNIMRRTASLGLMGIVIAVVGVMAATPAQAVTFYSGVPTKATSQHSVDSHSIGQGVLQIRRGTYDGKKYMWGRIASPDSTLNSGWDLKFGVNARPGCSAGEPDSTKKDIYKTTYTSAVVYNAKCVYWVAAEERNGDGYYLIDWMA